MCKCKAVYDRILAIASIVVLAASMASGQTLRHDPVDIVDPRIGTEDGAACVEGASSPFGLVNASPRRNRDFHTDWRGITTMELSGTGCSQGGLGTLTVRPQSTRPIKPWDEWSRVYWGSEIAHPYSFEYELESTHVRHAATTTEKAVLHRITFTKPIDSLYVVIDAGACYEPIRSTSLQRVGEKEWTAEIETGGFCGNAPTQKMYAWIEIQSDFQDVLTWQEGNGKGLVLTLASIMPSDTFQMRIGVSFVSSENARGNLYTQVGERTFNEVRELSRSAWQDILDRVKVSGGTKQDSVVFYTAVYRSMQYPAIYTDYNGQYLDRNDIVRTDTSYLRRTFYDIWGCAWGTYPLQSLIVPEHATDVARTILEHGRETGYLSNWEYLGDEFFMMGGDPQPQMIMDFWQRGIIKDVSEYYDILRLTARTQSKTRGRFDLYEQYGFVPSHDHWGEFIPSSVSFTLEYAMSDNALAMLAEAAGFFDERDILHQQAEWYRNLFDEGTGFFRQRRVDGSWTVPFDPTSVDGNTHWKGGGGAGYTEGTGWDYLFVPCHDVEGVAMLIGGRNTYVQRLDEYFSLNTFRLHNQPIFLHPFLYTFMPGVEWKSHRQVTTALKVNYSTRRNGIPGNDDLGSASSWAAWAMLGIYPVLDGNALYRICTPVFDSVVIQTADATGNPHNVVIFKTGSGPYVGSVHVDGNPSPLGSLPYSALQTASRIEMHCVSDSGLSLPDSQSSTDRSSQTTSSLTAYPNPSSSFCTVSVDDGSIWQLSIVDVLGRVLAYGTTRSVTTRRSATHFDISTFAPGTYLVCARSGDRFTSIPIAVQR